MKEVSFTPRDCPDCGRSTGLVNLGTEPPREACGRFGCSWDGVTLTPVRHTKDDGTEVIQ